MSFHNNDTSPSTALQIVSMTAVTGDWQEVTLIVTSSMLATSTAGKHGSVSADCCHYLAQYVCPTLRANQVDIISSWCSAQEQTSSQRVRPNKRPLAPKDDQTWRALSIARCRQHFR